MTPYNPKAQAKLFPIALRGVYQRAKGLYIGLWSNRKDMQSGILV